MGVRLGDNALIPAPIVKFDKQIQTAGEGTKLGVIYNITITGTLVAFKGSPQGGSLSGGSWGGPFDRFWQNTGYPPDESVVADSRLQYIENKQEALRALFATDGLWLEWQSADGSAPLKCQPRVKGITFSEGVWFDRCEYTIELESDYLYKNGNPEVDTPYHDELISSANESWQIEDADVAKTFKLTHTASAVGKRKFDSTGSQVGFPWQSAKDFIQNRLELGFDGISSFSPISGEIIAASSFLNNESALDLSTFNAYNFVRSETIDELAGSYTVNETWTLATASSGTDVYSVSVKKFSSEPNTTTSVGIQGTIKGFYTTLNDYDGRFSNAEYVWSQLQGTPLFTRVSSYTNANLNTQPLVGAIDYDPINGTITYNYEFSDRLFNGDSFEEYVISKTNSLQDYKYIIEVQGKIIGRRYESDTDPNDKFNRALAVWNNIKTSPIIYNRIIDSNYFPEIDDLRQNPVSKKVDMDQPNGMISYVYSFDNRKNDNDLNNENVHEEYNLSRGFSREDGKYTYTITGTVEGLSIVDGSGAKEAKYNAANDYWEFIAESAIVPRIQSIYDITLSNTNPIETEVQKNPTLGTITYTYKYTNEPPPYADGALSEVITFQDMNKDADINIFALIPVLGRTVGPVLQDMATTPERVRSVEIEAVFPPVGGLLLAAYASSPDYTSIINQLMPTASQVFKAEDSQTWIPRNGRYARSVKWIYQ
jgi:hypothetical protein